MQKITGPVTSSGWTEAHQNWPSLLAKVVAPCEQPLYSVSPVNAQEETVLLAMQERQEIHRLVDQNGNFTEQWLKW